MPLDIYVPPKAPAWNASLLAFVFFIGNKICWFSFLFKKCVNLHWFLNLLWIPSLRNTVHHWLFYYLTAIDKASMHKVPEKVNIYWFSWCYNPRHFAIKDVWPPAEFCAAARGTLDFITPYASMQGSQNDRYLTKSSECVATLNWDLNLIL